MWHRRVSIGAVRRHCADLFAFEDLFEQFWQHGAVTITARGEFHRANVRRGGVHRQMDLAPLAAALNAMLSRLPLAVTEELVPGAVNEQVQRPIGAPIAHFCITVLRVKV